MGGGEPGGMGLNEHVRRRGADTGNTFMKLDGKGLRCHGCRQGVRPYLWDLHL